MKSNNDQGRRSKEVSPKVEESLKEHSERKIPISRSKSSRDRSTDDERSPSPKMLAKKAKKAAHPITTLTKVSIEIRGRGKRRFQI